MAMLLFSLFGTLGTPAMNRSLYASPAKVSRLSLKSILKGGLLTI